MTYRATACPCCGSRSFDQYPALVSPFVATYALDVRPRPTTLLECKDCAFRFFEDRLTDAEAERLYSEYRGERYYRARHRYEPWYTRKVNDVVGQNDDVVRARRALVDGFLRRHLDVGKVRDVLDYGGDRGEIMPDALGENRFVFEISGKEPIAGVTKIGAADGLRGRSFDLVLLCHVLEHCSEPRAVLDEVRPLLQKSDARLYVELPYERASLAWLGPRRAYRTYLSALSRTGPLLTAIDLYSTALRMKLDVVPPLGFVKLHEHINFFSEESLRRVLDNAGFELIALEHLDIETDIGKTPVLSALAQPA